ncbi:MAG: RNA polymerase sigma factor [Actinobacteria bacterium]|nr:RNA polymerase sigma factor [Actinomycetota bacterium]
MDPAGVEAVFREEHGRAIAILVRRFGDIDLAEEAVQEAFLEALKRWPTQGPPPSPAGWIVTTARNRAIDRMRREALRTQRQLEAVRLHEEEDLVWHEIGDDRLRLVFTCCHPALSPEAQVALTLRLIGGLTTTEIAKAFLTTETTMAQRLVRAKRKIKAANIPYRVPGASEMPERLRPVLRVVYLVFNEGFLATTGVDLVRDDLASEGIRLARILATLMPDEPEVLGLLALVLLTQARRPARTDEHGRLVRLGDQDRTLWDQGLIAEGHDLVRRCLRRGAPGPYQIQAAVAAVHTDAPSATDTDWSQIVALYDQLAQIDRSPVVALNRAIAVGELEGSESALAALDLLDLRGYHLFHAARGDLLARIGRRTEATEAFDTALRLTENRAEQDYLTARIRSLG